MLRIADAATRGWGDAANKMFGFRFVASLY